MTKAAKEYGSLRMFLLRARRRASEQGSPYAIAV
jgi:hypothetical protein